MEIRKTREKKEKHKWAFQIMNELLKRAVMYEDEDSGMNPQGAAPSLRDNDETRPYEIVDGGKENIAEGNCSTYNFNSAHVTLPPCLANYTWL